MKYFWLYADGKTVKEISWEEYRKLFVSKNRYLLCRIYSDTEIAFRKGNNYIWLPLRQLKEILGNERR